MLMFFTALIMFLISCSLMNLDLYNCLLIFFFIELLMYSFLYVSKWYHLMMLLMILELFMLKIYFLSIGAPFNDLSSYFTFFFITLSVAEASIGLSLLTMLVRSNGDDFMFTGAF